MLEANIKIQSGVRSLFKKAKYGNNLFSVKETNKNTTHLSYLRKIDTEWCRPVMKYSKLKIII